MGLGTWKSKPAEVSAAVEAALRAGYRHIDTAHAYGNEREVGEGIKASGVPRSEIWLTTKLDNPWHKHVAEGLAASLEALQTDYLDLYLMHWPSSTDPNDKTKHYEDWDFRDTWREMQKLVGTGKVRNIGVSNFAIRNLDKLLDSSDCKVRQIYTTITLSIPGGYASLTKKIHPDHPRRQPDRAAPVPPLPQARRLQHREGHPLDGILVPRVDRLAALH